jgi:hypothetical protein
LKLDATKLKSKSIFCWVNFHIVITTTKKNHQCELYKGFFWGKKKWKRCHILKEKKSWVTPCSDYELVVIFKIRQDSKIYIHFIVWPTWQNLEMKNKRKQSPNVNFFFIFFFHFSLNFFDFFRIIENNLRIFSFYFIFGEIFILIAY